MNKKSRTVALLLTFFLGGFGIHKFYLGKPGQGALYFLFCWTFIPVIISFFEFWIMVFSSKEKFDQKYNPNPNF